MFRAQKNNLVMELWQPSASMAHLRHRAHILKLIRDFFAEREVMEVETPLMCHTSVTDPYIQSIPALFLHTSKSEEIRYYLQTSPEYAMKRLLAFGSGSIYQVTKAFRQGEVGRIHNPEFSMLEWYRVGFNHLDLMAEVDQFFQVILQMKPAQKKTYTEIFLHYLNINPHEVSILQLQKILKDKNIELSAEINHKDTLLDILMSQCIEPHLGYQAPCMIYDFPASQAALSQIIPGDIPVAARFEVYVQGMELANGFFELQDEPEQRQRFEQNLSKRIAENLTVLPLDELFLGALQAGLPSCAGVALGLDRLLMIALKANHISEVISFDFSRV